MAHTGYGDALGSDRARIDGSGGDGDGLGGHAHFADRIPLVDGDSGSVGQLGERPGEITLHMVDLARIECARGAAEAHHAEQEVGRGAARQVGIFVDRQAIEPPRE